MRREGILLRPLPKRPLPLAREGLSVRQPDSPPRAPSGLATHLYPPWKDCARFSADPTHSMPIRPIRGILTRAHERSEREPRDRASGDPDRSGRSGTAENKRAEVGADSRIDVDTLAYQSHSPNGHRRVKSLHLLPLSGRESSRSPSSTWRPFARKKCARRCRQETTVRSRFHAIRCFDRQ